MSSSPDMPLVQPQEWMQFQRSNPAHRLAVEEAKEAIALHREMMDPPFRFLDLPTELKDMIYSYHAAAIQQSFESTKQTVQTSRFFLPRTEKRRDLGRLRIPPLAQVCKELREDFLHIVFKEGAFDVDVIGDEKRYMYENPAEHGNTIWIVLPDVRCTPERPHKPLKLPRRIANLLQHDTIFQNVRFVMNREYTPSAYRAESRGRRLRRPVLLPPQQVVPWEMTFQWTEKRLLVENGPEAVAWHYLYPQRGIIEDVIRQVARETCAQEEFNGFAVADLRRIADEMVTQINGCTKRFVPEK